MDKFPNKVYFIFGYQPDDYWFDWPRGAPNLDDSPFTRPIDPKRRLAGWTDSRGITPLKFEHFYSINWKLEL